ncbi:hypothetical protein SRHO_G00039800 [Serrasalmus rhombeus]
MKAAWHPSITAKVHAHWSCSPRWAERGQRGVVWVAAGLHGSPARSQCSISRLLKSRVTAARPAMAHYTPAAYMLADEKDYLQAYEDVLEKYKGKCGRSGGGGVEGGS